MQGMENLAEWLDQLRKEWHVPGLGISVVRDGEVIFCEGFGRRDVEQGLKVTPTTRFAIGSTTKAFTCTAMAMLVDEGVLGWDTPIRNYLPDFKLYDSFATERITPRDLVTHRSGLPRYDTLWYLTSFSRSELVHRLRYLEPTYDFRTVYQYSNLMYMLAGYLVEKLTGVAWEDFIRLRILEPLNMVNSSPGLTNDPGFEDFALPYAKKDQLSRIPFFSKGAVGPCGAICSCASDMAEWMLLNLGKGTYGGDKKLVSEENLDQLHLPQMVIRNFGQLDPDEQLDMFEEIGSGSYGLGWHINSYRSRTMISHGGSINGFSALVSLIPDESLGITVLTNLDGTNVPYIATFTLYDRLLGAESAPWDQRIKELVTTQAAAEVQRRGEWETGRKPNAPRSRQSLEEYAGDYEHPAYGILTVAAKDSRLAAHYGGDSFILNHYHYDVFELQVGLGEIKVPVTFFGNARGEISHLSIPLEPAARDIVFTRKN